VSVAPTLEVRLAPLAAEGVPDDSAVTAAVRAYMVDARAHLRGLHEGGASGRAVNEANAALVDRLVIGLFGLAERAASREAGASRTGDSRLCVAAVGGYARRELCVHSDVDLLLLYRRRLDETVRGVAERLQRWLWDAGLTVGCATRTLDETLALADEDATVRWAVLDTRVLAGRAELGRELVETLAEDLRGRAERLVDEQRAAVAERHLKYGESLYLLQPNVKEGAGGLRDYHAAYWAARVSHPETREPADLARIDVLTPSELAEYGQALDFLWRVRNDLHLTAGRAADQMTFDLQESVAEHLGYGAASAPGPELPVERFMRDYYRHARAVESLSQLLLELCARHVRAAPEPRVVREVEEGFRIAEGHLEVPDAAHLRARPVRLLLAFEVAQRHDVSLSRTAGRLVRENLDLVDEAFRRDPEATAAFERILAAERRVMRTLLAMNELGLLAVWWPEWEHIVCRWQHVIYHTYTVDVHSIFLVEELRRLWQGKYAAALPELTDLVRAVADRPVLFLGCLLHDIGKGRGGNHSQRGLALARACLERMGVDEVRRDRVLFLVEHHLLMAHVAQRRDLSDPKLIAEFARTVGDRENLRNLYLLTFADIRASSRTAWSEWKGQLLGELFERTAELLETEGGEEEAAAQIEALVAARREAGTRELRALGVAESRIEAYFDMMPRRYFVAHNAQQIARHAMVMLSFTPERVVSTQVRSMRGDFSELIVVTRDVHGLYATVCGVLAARWINILASHVYTTRTGLALEIYRLATPPGPPEERHEVWRAVQSTLHGVLSGVVDVRELLRRRGRPVGVTASPSKEPPRVSISNAESDFYTIVDVTANDRIGLLYDLTRVLADQGLEIFVSRASTILDQVADTFYVKDADGKKLSDPARIERLREALLAAARGPEEVRGG
jgi:[protein-PII] uridylyltransferase